MPMSHCVRYVRLHGTSSVADMANCFSAFWEMFKMLRNSITHWECQYIDSTIAKVYVLDMFARYFNRS